MFWFSEARLCVGLQRGKRAFEWVSCGVVGVYSVLCFLSFFPKSQLELRLSLRIGRLANRSEASSLLLLLLPVMMVVRSFLMRTNLT